MSRYKLLILDYGGVFSFDYVAGNFEKIMTKTFGVLPSKEQKECIGAHSHIFGAGKMNTKEYIGLVGKILGTETLPTTQEFEDATIEVTSPPSKEMTKLVADVRAMRIPVSLLSDMYMFEVERTKEWGRYDGFDYVSFSAEAGMTKHDPRFFQETLSHFNVLGSETLFVDDTRKNIETAKLAGLDTLYADKTVYSNAGQLAQEVRHRLST